MADYILDRFTAADDTLIHGRTTETGETWTAQVSAMKIASNRAVCSVNSTRAICTLPTSWADASIEINLRIANVEGGYVGVVLRWTDSSNYWLFQIYREAGNAFRLYEVNSGTETLRAFDNPAFSSDSDIKIRAVCSGSTITVTATQGATSLQIQYASATHNQSATTHGFMLEKTADSANDVLIWEGAGSPPANPLYSAITLTSPASLQVFQRSGTTGEIAISGNFSGGGTHDIEASFNGGAYVTIDTGSTGAFSGTLSGQAQGQGTVTVRFVDDTGVSATASNVGIGDVYVLAGQSNMSGRGTDAQSWGHATLYASQFGNNYLWAQLAAVNDSNVAQVDAVSSDADAAQNYIPRLATAIMADQDVPVAFVPCAMGATAIASWLPGADHQDRTTLYGSMVYRALAVGGVKAVIFHQGESDATVNSFTGGATYKSRLKTLASAVYDDLGVPLVVCRIHCWSGAPDTSQANVNEINAAMAAAAAEDSHILLGANFDSPTPVTTSLHFTTDAELTDAAARLWSALDALFYTVVAGKTEPAIRLAAINNYWSLNDYLVLAAQSFDDGGSIVHLDAAPYFVIYNAATGALVASGSTSAIDNTVGLYVARVQLTTAAGFATGANYVVRVTANLDGKTLADLAVFNAGEAAVNVTYSAGVALTGRLAEAADIPAAVDVSALALEATAQAILLDTGTTLPAAIAVIDSNVDLLLAVDTSTTDATTAGAISRRRGNSWAIPLTIGAITGYTSLWFTIKSSYDDVDTAALLQIKLNASGLSDGLLYVNGTTASSDALGSITVSDATTGAIVVNLDETITDDLAPGTYYYDVQTLISGNVATPDSGVFTVTADVTRSVA